MSQVNPQNPPLESLPPNIRVGAGTDADFILRKPVRTSELLAQVAGEG